MKRRFDPVEGRNADIIEAVMSDSGIMALDDPIQFKIRLCVEEVEENILCYSGSTWVEVTADVDDGEAVITFKDGGVQFNPLEKQDPDINAPVEERSVGGLGIFLCKQMMDSLEYRQDNGCNYFKMVKKLN